MGQAGDDRFVDSQAHPDEGDPGDRGSFDPGLETGYLRRAPRDHELSPELGAAPFDPGPDLYDERRAKRREREARRQRQAELKAQETRNAVQRASSGRAQATALQPAFDAEPRPAGEPDLAPRPEPPSPPASVTQLRPRREPLAERLERERAALRPARRAARAKPAEARPATARIEPAVRGPVKKGARAAENRMRGRTKRRGLFWPTAKAGLALTVAMALGAGLGSLLGLPVPGLDETTGNPGLVNSASLFGIDPGTPTGLVHGYVFPLRGPHDFGDRIARFGAPRYGHIHEGQDIFGKTGTPEVAVHDGIVVDRGRNSDPDDGGRGNYVVIYSPSDNHSFVYMHMLKPSPVGLGQKIHSGDVVGQLGCTGSCEGPHLHFEVRVGKASLGADTKPLDPLPFLQQWPQSTPG